METMTRRKSKTTSIRVAEGTEEKVSEIALGFGYEYGGRGGSIGQLLDAIARGEVLLIPSQKNKNNS